MTTPNPTTCARCGHRTVKGFLLDQRHLGSDPLRWVEGPPRFGWFGGLKTLYAKTRTVRADRCEGCGRVELFADEPHYSP